MADQPETSVPAHFHRVTRGFKEKILFARIHSGDIDADLGSLVQSPVLKDGRSLRFITGSEDGEVEIETHSGDVTLRVKPLAAK